MSRIEDIDRALVRVWRWFETAAFVVVALSFWAFALFAFVAAFKFMWRLLP